MVFFVKGEGPNLGDWDPHRCLVLAWVDELGRHGEADEFWEGLSAGSFLGMVKQNVTSWKG